MDFSNVPVAVSTKEASEKQEIKSVPAIQENVDVANRHAKLAEKDAGKILDAKAAGAPIDTSLDTNADKNESTSAAVPLTTKSASVKEVAQPADPVAENVAEHVVAQLVKQTEESGTPVVQVAKDTKTTLPESTTPKTVPTTPEKVDVSTGEETFGSAPDPSDLRESTSTVLVDKPKDNQPTTTTTTTKDGESPNDIGSDKNWVTVETKNNEDSEEVVPAVVSTEELPAETTAATLSQSSPKATTATSPIKKKGPGAPKAGARRSNKKKKGKKKK